MPTTHPAVEATAWKGGGNVRKHQARDRNRTRTAQDPRTFPTGILRDSRAWHPETQKALSCSSFHLDSLGNR
jgi:hypothetical protein